MHPFVVRVIALFALAFAAYGQRLSVGVVGGTRLTGDFPYTDTSTPVDGLGNPGTRFQYMSGPRSLIIGALVEVRLREQLSIEANVLHRPMKLSVVYPDFPARGAGSTAVRAWEFPVMLKYTLPWLRSPGRVPS